MNKLIKFRAYDKVEKEMLTILEMDWYPNHVLRYLKAIDKNNKEWYYDSPDDIKDNLIIDQFTGFIDINGKDIYAGSIIQCNEEKDMIFSIGTEDDCHGYYVLNALGTEFISPIPLGLLLASNKVKVIGNVFENPELLEENK